MGRREDFARTMRHEKPENLIIDFGGQPAVFDGGESENKLLEFLGFGKKQGGDLPFGKTRRLDERLLKYFDIDTRSVGEIFTPRRTHIFRRYRKRSTSTNGASAGGLPGCTGRA